MGAVGWLKAVTGAVAGMVVMVNLPTRYWLPSNQATLQYLKETDLHNLAKDEKDRKLYKEAAELSSLLPELSKHGVELHAVVHEPRGVEEFRSFFKGEIHLDKERRFYGPKQRWMFLTGFLRASVWMNLRRAGQKNVPGNMEGEGRLLGGLFVVGPREQGIIYEYRESEWGDHAPKEQILEAVRKIKPASSKL